MSDPTSLKPGLLLFAHGARDPRWAQPFEAVAQRVRQARPGVPVVLAYLEIMAPDMAGAARLLAAQGCARIEVLPLFLGTGGHVRQDLPALVEAVRREHPQLQVQLHPAVGDLPAVVNALADAALSLLEGAP